MWKSDSIMDFDRTDYGITQSDRTRYLLHPELIKLDERNIYEFILKIAKLAEAKPFTNESLKEDGTWASFFDRNPLFIAASCMSWPMNAWYQELQNDLSRFERKPTDGRALDVLKRAATLFQFIDSQIDKASDAVQFDLNKSIRDELKQLVQSAAGNAFLIFRRYASTNPLKSNRLNDQKWSTYWPDLDIKMSEEKDIGGLVFDLKQMSVLLKEAFDLFRTRLKSKLELYVTDSGNHDPHIGLLIAFIRSLNDLQDHINQFSYRHLDYFYRNILNQTNRAAIADKVYAIAPLASHKDKALINANERVTAGTYENGSDILYNVVSNWGINRAEIQSIRQLYFARNKAVGISERLGFISGLYSAQFELNSERFLVEKGSERTVQPVVFGQDQISFSLRNRNMQFGRIGFAFSAPILFLQEGERSVQFDLTFDALSMTSLIAYVEEMSNAQSLSPDAALQLMLAHIFRIEYTGPEGWKSIPNYGISVVNSWSEGTLRLELKLGLSDPAVVAYNKAIHGEGFHTDFPLFSFSLKADETLYGYSFIKDLKLEEYQIHVNVQQIKSLTLLNNSGALDPNSVFNPFGFPANPGTYFIVGYPELAAKNLTDLEVELDWFNLPRLKGGLESYYDAYDLGLKNEDFKVEVSLLSGYQYKPEASNEEKLLFELNETDHRLKKTTVFRSFDLDRFAYEPTYSLPENLDIGSEAGMIKFELSEPESGFGSQIYPNLLSKVMLFNASEKKEEKHKAIPNEPFNPQLNAIRLHYAASTKVSLEESKLSINNPKEAGKLFHLSPFHTKCIFENALPSNQNLVPHFDKRGYLFIDLKGSVNSGELNILFGLDETDKIQVNHQKAHEIQWLYQMEGEWVKFKPQNILSDETNHLTNSGIIRFKMPDDFVKYAQKMESLGENISICATTTASYDHYPRIEFVSTNACQLKWFQSDLDESWQGPLAPQSLQAFAISRSDITELYQPYPSFGGYPPEDNADFYLRVANHIQHKQRLFRNREIESFLLDSFPWLYQVKCFGADQLPEDSNSDLTVICIPKIEQDRAFKLPFIGEKDRQIIRRVLLSRLSNHVRINVLNPHYERLRVVANIMFDEEADTGQMLQQLSADIQSFICPWFSSTQSAMSMKARIDKDQLQDYLSSLGYVQFVSKFSLLLIQEDQGSTRIFDTAVDEGEMNTLYPWSVIVPDKTHDITIVDETEFETAQAFRLARMQVGEDFVLGLDQSEQKTDRKSSKLGKDQRIKLTFRP